MMFKQEKRDVRRNEREIVRDCFLQVIPATDITYQGIYRKQFTELTKYHIANPSVPFTVSDRTLFMQMVLKCADISNPCRNWPVCEEWAKRVCTDYFVKVIENAFNGYYSLYQLWIEQNSLYKDYKLKETVPIKFSLALIRLYLNKSQFTQETERIAL
ncbi:unnamed protein product [Heterobilharzia americana]|nr:unnamed protein product [Heterobilharzia americana]